MDHEPPVVGFDVAVIDKWLPTVTDVAGPLRWHRLPGGHSNLTYLITDANGRELVIRRPPAGELLPKAHDMSREYRIIDALWPTQVPVPEPIAYRDDRALAPVHFYVMGKAEGRALYAGVEVAGWLDETGRRHAGECFIDTLAALHSLDPDDVGLGDFAKRDGYVERQIRTWYGSWTASSPIANYDDARMHELHSLLTASLPEQGPGRIVHGDFGPHNALFDEAGDIQAVLDWELATLGDPFADFAYSINAWVEPGDVGVYGADPPTALPGFPSRSDLIERYAAATAADMSLLGYYRSFNYFKTAGILLGVYARYIAGQKSTDGVDVEGLLKRVIGSIDAAVVMAEAL
ncbi:MAG TPA: phosphotransferase family protein [Ilumatobacter sp.]|nr:phosphotransferase family protein [Ilumatobacter sp.]